MLGRGELQALTAWCARRGLGWAPASQSTSRGGIVLHGRSPDRPWQGMMLVQLNAGYCLENEAGETLATASSLAAVLDALDGGIVSRRRYAGTASDLAGRTPSMWAMA